MVNARGLAGRRTQALWALLESVHDPEIPVLSLRDLGVLRDVRVEGECVSLVVTPTYTGCPAMLVMQRDIKTCLVQAGYKHISIENRLAPAWTTDWITSTGREKLRRYGIAPPQPGWPRTSVCCPKCGCDRTNLISEFGSTACKAIMQCAACLEPFDYFKCL